MAIFLRNGVNQEHFIPQMHLLLRKTPLIMWLLWKNKLKAPQTSKAVFCLPFGVFPLCIDPSLSFSRFISSACLPRVYLIFWSHFSPFPCRCFPSSITPRLFSFFPCVYFQETGARARWVETLGSVLVVFCVFNLLYQHPALGGRVRKRKDNAHTIKGGLPQ